MVIVGGAVIGSSVAYWLTELGYAGSVLVIERDPSYARSSTALSASSIRLQFSNPVNVKISRFGVDFIRDFPRRMAPFYPGATPPELGFREHGYLYCCPPEGVDRAHALVETQRAEGAQTVFLDRDALAARFPWLETTDLGGATWGARDEGWFDSMGLLDGFRRGARARGVTYLTGEVTGISRQNGRIAAVALADGQSIACGTLVNAAGPRAARLATMAGIALPVEPRKRHTFVFASARPIPGRMPLVIDTSGVYVRPEGAQFLSGVAPEPDPAADYGDFDLDPALFEDRIWPALYHRIPAFDALRVGRGWVGHYAMNTLDANALLGPHPEVDNLLFANGFSGHGLQQSPAVGRGIAEWIVAGRYLTLDLSDLSVARVTRGAAFLEQAII